VLAPRLSTSYVSSLRAVRLALGLLATVFSQPLSLAARRRPLIIRILYLQEKPAASLNMPFLKANTLVLRLTGTAQLAYSRGASDGH
jgi:hypothetical protein